MGKIVDADELYAAFRRDIMGGLNYDRILREAKPVDAVPVRHGQWIERGYMGNDNWDYMCSVCGAGEVHTKRVEVRYCWNCGARMDGKDGNDD